MLSLEPDVFGHDSLRIQKELYIHQQQQQQDPAEYACSATDTSSSETNTTSPEESSPPKKTIKPRKKIAKRNTGIITSHSESIEQSRFAPLLQMTLKQFETNVTKHRLLSKRDETSNVEGDE